MIAICVVAIVSVGICGTAPAGEQTEASRSERSVECLFSFPSEAFELQAQSQVEDCLPEGEEESHEAAPSKPSISDDDGSESSVVRDIDSLVMKPDGFGPFRKGSMPPTEVDALSKLFPDFEVKADPYTVEGGEEVNRIAIKEDGEVLIHVKSSVENRLA